MDDRQAGAAAVEFAVVLPLLLTFLFGLLDVGQLLYTRLVMTDGAREAVRALVLTPGTGTDPAAAHKAVDAASPWQTDTNATSITACDGTTATASVTLHTRKLSYWIPGYLPGLSTFTITETASMTCLQ